MTEEYQKIVNLVMTELFYAKDSGEELCELVPFIKRDAEKIVSVLYEAGLLRLPQKTTLRDGDVNV